MLFLCFVSVEMIVVSQVIMDGLIRPVAVDLGISETLKEVSGT